MILQSTSVTWLWILLCWRSKSDSTSAALAVGLPRRLESGKEVNNSRKQRDGVTKEKRCGWQFYSEELREHQRNGGSAAAPISWLTTWWIIGRCPSKWTTFPADPAEHCGWWSWCASSMPFILPSEPWRSEWSSTSSRFLLRPSELVRILRH